MSNGFLHRREFLRLTMLLAGGTLVASCQEWSGIGSTKGNMPSAFQLNGDNSDVWAFRKQVRGSMQNPAACQSVLIENGDARAQAALHEYVFSADVPIRPGRNTVSAVCQGAKDKESFSSQATFTGRLPQRPTAIITPSLSNKRVLLDGAGSLADELEQQPLREYIWTAHPANPAAAVANGQAFSGEVKRTPLELEVPRVNGEYYFSLRVMDEAEREDTSTTYFVVEDGQPRIPDHDHENPAWVEQAIVYGVIPRLFGTPGAKAIQQRLDDLADLGINAMWLAPINATPDYGYSVLDYFELRESFGSKEDFRAMVQAAHARGIRVLMDFVPNHTSSEHAYFRDTVEKGEDSNYWDFYDRDEDGHYTYYFDWTHLPNLNYDNPEVRRMMIEAFSYWVREFDVDGFRVDACWGVQKRRPDFWPEWRRELKHIKPDLLLLAEASARDPYNFDSGFDAAYDWTENLGNWAWARFWGEQAPKTETALMVSLLRDALRNEPEGYHPDALIFRFLNNNDTGTRFITTHGEEMTRVATALLLTLPGIPCIYTADEVGEWFRPYFDAAPLSWRERYPGLRDYHKHLIALRKEVPSLHSRFWQMLAAEPAGQVLGYVRFLAGNARPVIVLLNFSAEAAEAVVSLPEAFATLATGTALQDLLSDDRAAVDAERALKVVVPRYGVRLLAAA